MTRTGSVPLRRAARARAEATAWGPAASPVPVVRYDPPEIGECQWPTCRAAIEWVETLERGLLPVTHPLTVINDVRRFATSNEGTKPEVGRSVTIAAAQCHLARCPEAPVWLRRRWGGGLMPAPYSE